MGRPREFDPSAAVAAATQEFWRRGYGATSVRDLADAMSITGASLYNAFGDKRSLFQLCLSDYLNNYARRRIAELDSSDDPVDGIRVFFNNLVEASLSDPRGCLLVNSAIEVAPADPELGKSIQSCLMEIEDGFHRAFIRLSLDKAIPARDPRSDAGLMLSAIIALRVLARAGGEEAHIRRIAGSAIAVAETWRSP